MSDTFPINADTAGSSKKNDNSLAENGLELLSTTDVEAALQNEGSADGREGNAAADPEDDDEKNGIPTEGNPLTKFEAYCGDRKLTRKVLFTEILSGISVSIAQVPEAVAFALVAGVSPLVGMQAAWIIGLVTAVAGGRPAMISGATGAIAAVVGDLAIKNGVEVLFYTVILMGIVQIVLGFVRADKLLRLLPHPVMIGFCNGLAILIGTSQIGLYKEIAKAGTKVAIAENEAAVVGRRMLNVFGIFSDNKPWIQGEQAWLAIMITTVCFLVAYLFPRISKAVPSSLIAIILGLGMEWGIARQVTDRGTATVEDFAGIKEAWPMPVWADSNYNMPPITGTMLKLIFPYATMMALVGLIESLITLTFLDELTQTVGDSFRECLGQGIANVICGMFGGMGGCATMGQALINVNSGARLRISSMAAGLFLLVTLVLAYPLINMIPLAALAGVMFNIVVHTFEWGSLRIMFFSSMPTTWRAKFGDHAEYKVPRADAFCILLVTVVTLLTDLAIAVITGIIFSALMHAWTDGAKLTVEVDATESGRKEYIVHGNLFFANIQPFLSSFDIVGDPKKVICRFEHSALNDFSALEALNTLAQRYERVGKKVIFEALTDELSLKMLRKAGGLLAGSYEMQTETVDVDAAMLHVSQLDRGKDQTGKKDA